MRTIIKYAFSSPTFWWMVIGGFVFWIANTRYFYGSVINIIPHLLWINMTAFLLLVKYK